MDGAFQVRQDPLLRQFLSNPQVTDRLVQTTYGFAAMRLLVAGLDALQVVAVGVASSALLCPGHMARAFGIGLMTAAMALLIRRGIRSTTSFHKTSVGTVARRAGLAVGLACAVTLTPILLLPGQDAQDHALWIVVWCGVSALMSAGMRGLPIPLLSYITLRAICPHVAIVGTPSSTRMMAQMLSDQGSHQVVAQLDPDRLLDIQKLEALAAAGQLDKVVLVGCDEAEVERICFCLSDTPTLVCLGFATSAASSLLSCGLHATQQPPFLPLLPSPMSEWRYILKRASDVALVLVLIPLLSPVLVGAALAIAIESPGPILFRQWRFGLGSKPTRILKFRTMFHGRGDHTGEVRTMARDPRVTAVGRILRRTSIDELPQLLNVLRGEMSLVGPRPHATHMKVGGDYYFEAVQGYRIRHRVKPGITGWAQVTGSRGEVDTMEKALLRVEKDLWYVRNWSLTLDLRILVMTALGRFASPTAD